MNERILGKLVISLRVHGLSGYSRYKVLHTEHLLSESTARELFERFKLENDLALTGRELSAVWQADPVLIHHK